MAVLTTPRRITLYWLLLLLPALAVGTGAIILLRREQARLAERSAYADEARRAAVVARARLIVENVELLVGDVEAGLIDTLATEPAATVDAFLDQLEQANPLVRTAFRAAPDGSMLRPNPRSANEDGRGFLKRFTKQFGRQPPWSTTAVAQKVANEKRQQAAAFDESQARQDVARNVYQTWNGRREVQELFKNTQNLSIAQNELSAPAPAAKGAGLLDAVKERDAAAPSQRPAEAQSLADVRRAGAGAEVAGRSRALPQAVAAATAPGAKKDAVPDRSGWAPATIDGRLHLFAWMQPGGAGEVRGVEVELTALVSRLASTMPAELSGSEGYALQDGEGRVLQQAGAIPKNVKFGGPVVTVPLSAALLPGWQVAAYMAPAYETGRGTMGFFWPSALLVTIFVAAILLGGALLLWQARRSEEEAAQKTSFVANVSHEFKTPLTTIRLYSELLEQGRVRDSGQAGEYLRTIGRETQRLARLVNNALDFSRLEQGKKKYARESVDLGAEIGRLLETYAPRVREAGLELRRDTPVDPVRVSTDRDALEQIVINLLDNACKYAGDGREVTVVVAARPGAGAEVRVCDRGPGVPEEHREQIFEKFHRVDDRLTAEKTGAGLGLSIARQLARGLGGDVRYAPRDGGGAEFILELP